MLLLLDLMMTSRQSQLAILILPLPPRLALIFTSCWNIVISPLQFRLAALQTLAAVQKVGKEGSMPPFAAQGSNGRIAKAGSQNLSLVHLAGHHLSCCT